jgi:hypothetical protein
MERSHTGLAYETLTDEQKLDLHSSASELYQATSMFLHQSDRRHRYGKLLEELENDFTKGNDDYPETLVNHLIRQPICDSFW